MFAPQTIEALRQNYGAIDRMDPENPTYLLIIDLLNKMPQDMLRQLADANIKFISALARNRIK